MCTKLAWSRKHGEIEVEYRPCLLYSQQEFSILSLKYIFLTLNIIRGVHWMSRNLWCHKLLEYVKVYFYYLIWIVLKILLYTWNDDLNSTMASRSHCTKQFQSGCVLVDVPSTRPRAWLLSNWNTLQHTNIPSWVWLYYFSLPS